MKTKYEEVLSEVLAHKLEREQAALCPDINAEHIFSDVYNEKIKRITEGLRSDKPRSLSPRRRFYRAVAVAAILALLLALAVTAIAVGDMFSLFKSVDLGGDIAYTTSVGDPEAKELLLEPSFIPEGFNTGTKESWGNGFKIKYSNGETYWTYSQESAGYQLSISTENCNFYRTENIGPYTVHIRQYYGRYTQMYWATERFVYILNFNDLATAEFADEIILSLTDGEV